MVMNGQGRVPKQFAPEAKAGGVEINLQYGERSGDLKPARQRNNLHRMLYAQILSRIECAYSNAHTWIQRSPRS